MAEKMKFLCHFHLHIRKAQIIGNHSDELAVGRLAAAGLYSIAEIGIEGIYVASVPSDLNGVANGSLDS